MLFSYTHCVSIGQLSTSSHVTNWIVLVTAALSFVRPLQAVGLIHSPPYVSRDVQSSGVALTRLHRAINTDFDGRVRDSSSKRLSPAKIIEPPINVRVIAGETALFFCRATGNPTPTVNFLIDRTISHPRLGVGVVLTIPDGSLLRLTKAHREQNGLQVECVARNHVGGDSATARLTVYEANSDVPEGYPVIHVAPKPTTAAVGDIARLECDAAGNPTPRVIWIKNEIPIPTSGSRISIVGTGSLLFDHILLSDEGHYECLVTNTVGSVLSSKAYLSVKNTYFVPKIVDKVDQVRVRPGHGANLTCRAAGNPIPSTRWLTDRERPITESKEGVATLFLADVTEPARYICEANNSLGTVQHPVRVNVLEIPPPPQNLRCLEEGSTYAFLQWYPPTIPRDTRLKVPDGQIIDSYTLFLTQVSMPENNGPTGQQISSIDPFRKQLTDIPARQFHPDGALQYKVTDLKPYTNYSVEVAAISNVLGMSDPSNRIVFTTAEVAPGSTPRLLNAVAVSDTTIRVAWQPPLETNGKILRYTVAYSRDPKLPLGKWRRVETSSESTQIGGLQSAETYYISVSASNSAGSGPFSESIPVIVKFGVPSQPINFRGVSLTPDRIYLNWSAPDMPKSVRLQDYFLRFRGTQSENVHTKPTEYAIAPTLTSYLMENLSPNTTYHISLAARTTYGVGVSAQIKVRTESNVPGIPVIHEIDALDSSRIRVRWLAAPVPSIDWSNLTSGRARPSQVQQFLVQWAPFPFTDWDEKRIRALSPVARQVHELVIGGLLSRTAYRIRIMAIGSDGMSAALELGPLKTKGEVPSAPRNLRLNQLRRALPPGVTDPSAEFAVLELAWDPPERSHGDLRGYQVSHRLIGPPELLYSQRSATDAGPQKPIRRNVTQTAYTSTLADGIKFGRVYQFEVAAYNGVDLGLPAQLNVSTPEDIPDNFPVQVRLNGLSATAIEVTWSPPLHQQWPGEILSYQVRYFQPSSPNTTEVITNTAEPRLRIENLSERTFYTVMVRAITSNGPGPWSMASTIRTTAELPEPPSQITGVRINQRQIKVTWTTLPPGAKSTVPGQTQTQTPVPITGFRIYYSKNENPQDLSTWQILDVGPVTMATLDSLDPTSGYVIKIKSRGADRRYGRLSDPVVVGTHVPEDGSSFGSSVLPGGRAMNEKRAIRQLSCHWIPALDNARPGEASLKLNWQRPAQVDGLYQFQIQLLGSKSYTDQNNQPHRVHFEPRTLEVSSAMLDSSLAPSTPMNFGLNHLTPEQQPQYSLVIDELEANTVYDVQIRPLYKSPTLGHVNEADSPMGRTSCRTLMLPPTTVPRPVPTAVKPQTGQVVMRVFRVSESLGRIRRYYLILSKSSATDTTETNPAVPELYWQNKLHDASQLWNPDTFIAAEYSQEVFVEPQLEILLSSPNYNRIRRLSDWVVNVSSSQSMQSDIPSSPAPDVLVYGRQLIKDQDYRAFVLACIYPNSEPTSKYEKSGVIPTQTTSSRLDEDAPAANLCTASTWSVPFSPNKPITHVDENGDQTSSETGMEPKARPRVNQAGASGTGTDMFTISLIAVIVGLGIVAIVCIAVGCVMRRRRPKQLRNDMSITLVNSDNTLKTPLMNPKLSTFSEPNGKIDSSQAGFQTPESVPNVACVANSIPHTPTKVRSAVTATHLPEHVIMLKANGGMEMAEEYESLETGVGLTWKHANLEVNRPKNRYANVVAYDHSRVLLSSLGDVPGSDYINANYIDGYQRSKAYIATQGPLPETFYDFWRMVWEQNSYVIVMMTRLEERARVKCDQYWPTRGVDTYTSPHASKLNPGPTYKVSLKDTAEFAYYTLRTFHLVRQDPDAGGASFVNRIPSQTDLTYGSSGGVDSREIKQFQFTAWPDYGTPDHAQPLLLFIRRVTQVRAHILHQLQQERLANGDSVVSTRGTGVDLLRTNSPQPTSEMGPTIVHCSAGVGRTGAFIVIDSQLERLRHEKSVDIYGSVSRMRNQRNFMVQTEEQYTFLYDVFVEAATVIGTEVTAHGLYNHVVKLRQTSPSNLLVPNKPNTTGLQDSLGTSKVPIHSGQSGLEMEFHRLNVNLYNKKQFTSAILPENRLKNRSNEMLPFESNRVCLPLIRGLSGSDYINASFVDGYRKKRAYIATQTPLPNTIDDFWRLIWEHNSPIIVMLNETMNQTGPIAIQSDIYWPMERSTRYQHLLVEPMVEYNMPHFILREFRLTDTRDGQSRTLRQFQLHGWSNDQVVPKSAEAMIDLIGQVHKTQTQFGQDGPITVHCSTGSGRTAVFICLSLLLERMRCEGMVDVFLTTRMLRTQRTQMIQTADQYAFCYAATLEYLASFDHYTS